ncbi:MAG: thioredoxin family protein [Muribaculaceae bacterium]|nr:thioredoxin family protein [Muribaculaceae bacterium]
MRKFTLLIITLVASIFSNASAQLIIPVKWDIDLNMTGDKTGQIVMKASILNGWHMYSNEVDPSAGPTPLSITFTTLEGAELVGGLNADKKAITKYDDMFGAQLSWWTGDVTLTQDFKLTADTYDIAGYVTSSACNDENCVPPSKEQFSFSNSAVDTAEVPVAQSPGDKPTASSGDQSNINGPLWEPVNFTEQQADSVDTSNVWYIFFTCFIGGFVALLTPCVWPMIPLTVSFFLKKGKSRAKSITDAFIYGASIIVIYLALGLIITACFGASALNALSTSAVCNIIFFLLLVVFAISFFGAFDIKLPASWSNKIDSTAEKTTGLLSIFFMAFTLTLVSFSCTGPIIGTLLVEAASTGDKFGPAIGMFGFSLALAIPFCLFAMFPSWLQSAPKSGGWMNTVKVVLGFIELALSLKFLSVADLAYGWHILDREIFLALWIITFVLLGLYLLGKFNFSHYGPADSSIGVFRFFLSLISLSFAMYLVPGLWGAPLKGVSAFVPPLYTQDFNLYDRGLTEYDDYEEGMRIAAKEDKPVLIDFSGYGCVNCRKMEGAVLDNEDVHTMINDNFIVIKLMVDEKRKLPQPIVVTENGKKVTLETYGDKWSYLQRYKFQANAQPYYVIVNDKGNLLSGPFSYDENIPRFTAFLEKGIKGFRK